MEESHLAAGYDTKIVLGVQRSKAKTEDCARGFREVQRKVS